MRAAGAVTSTGDLFKVGAVGNPRNRLTLEASGSDPLVRHPSPGREEPKLRSHLEKGPRPFENHKFP